MPGLKPRPTKKGPGRKARACRLLRRGRGGTPAATTAGAEDGVAVGRLDRGHADVHRRRKLRADTADGDDITHLQRVLAPALAIQRIRRSTLDLVHDRLAVGTLHLDVRV